LDSNPVSLAVEGIIMGGIVGFITNYPGVFAKVAT
jgi:hypothetical protein